MAINQEAMEKFLEKHNLENRCKSAELNTDKLRKQAQRRQELIRELLKDAWGRELWYDIIADADVLKENAMTGNSHGFYIQGKQVVAKHNMDWVKKFHFNEWLLMEQEAHNRKTEEENE